MCTLLLDKPAGKIIRIELPPVPVQSTPPVINHQPDNSPCDTESVYSEPHSVLSAVPSSPILFSPSVSPIIHSNDSFSQSYSPRHSSPAYQNESFEDHHFSGKSCPDLIREVLITL